MSQDANVPDSHGAFNSDVGASVSSREDSKVISEHIRVYCRLKPEEDSSSIHGNASPENGISQGLYLTGADSDDRKGADSSFIWDPVAAECTYIPHSAARRPSAVLLGPTNAAPPGSQTFHFNGVFGFDAKQDEVFSVVAQPIVDSVLRGYSGTVLAYGPTGSGKTHTMRGPVEEGGPGPEAGIIPRSLEYILASPLVADCTVWVSYLQIYCEELYDLLLPPRGDAGTAPMQQDLQIRERDGQVFVEGLSRTTVTSLEDLDGVLRQGDANRIVASTTMNEVSSRSHAALIVSIVPTTEKYTAINGCSGRGLSGSTANSKGAESRMLKERSLVLVDLSGSERASASGGRYIRLEEAKAINLSLSALGNCISALCENRKHVPYRDSKLTRLLQGSLGGGCRTAIIVTIPPTTAAGTSGTSASMSNDQSAEVIAALRFAARAGRVQVSAKVHRYIDYEAMYERAQQQLDEQTAINRSLEQALARKSERAEELESTVDSLRMEVRTLRSSLSALEERVAASGGDSSASGGLAGDSSSLGEASMSHVVQHLMRQQAEDMETLRQQMEKRVVAYRSASSQAAQELSSVLLEVQQQKEGYADALRDLRDSRCKAVEIERSANARATELLGEVSDLQRALDDARAAAAEQEGEIEGLRAAVEALTERLSEAAVEIESRVPKAKVEEMEFLFSDTISRLWSRVAQLESRHRAAERAASQRLDDCGGGLNFDALDNHLPPPSSSPTAAAVPGGAGRIRTVQQLSAAYAMSGRPSYGGGQADTGTQNEDEDKIRSVVMASSQSVGNLGTSTHTTSTTATTCSTGGGAGTVHQSRGGIGHSISASVLPASLPPSSGSVGGKTHSNTLGPSPAIVATGNSASNPRPTRGALW